MFQIHLLHLTGAWSPGPAQKPDPSRHLFQKMFRHWLIYGDNILFLMSISASHDFIHQIPLVGHEKQSLLNPYPAFPQGKSAPDTPKVHNILSSVLISGGTMPFGLFTAKSTGLGRWLRVHPDHFSHCIPPSGPALPSAPWRQGGCPPAPCRAQ